KGNWTEAKDAKVVELVQRLGAKKWSAIAVQLPDRSGRQCWTRWHDHLSPDINKSPWTREEDLKILEAHEALGNRWAEIAKVRNCEERTTTTRSETTSIKNNI
ncbi:hypothetical protein TL16_g11343, partial [Triparma laevis f. inornata]